LSSIPSTLIFGSLAALLLALLGANVSRVRNAKKALVGGEVDHELHRVVRAHGNAAEWIPILVLMLLILELSGASQTQLTIFGATILVSRLLHGLGMIFKSKVSTVGASLTYLLAIGMPIEGLILHFKLAQG
jgi:uncharacterized membrane protein YecN with MAPEG domain